MSEKNPRYDGLGVAMLGLAALILVLAAISGFIHPPTPVDAEAVQQSMAWANWAVVWVSLGGGLIGAISLYLIYRTLQAAFRSALAAEAAVIETRKIGSAQVRAYLSADTFTLIDLPRGFLVDFTYHNSGQSPARAVAIDIYVAMHNNFGQSLKGVSNQTDVIGDIPAGGKSRVSFRILDTSPRAADEEFSVVASVTFRYTDVFGDPQSDSAAADLSISAGEPPDERPMRARSTK